MTAIASRRARARLCIGTSALALLAGCAGAASAQSSEPAARPLAASADALGEPEAGDAGSMAAFLGRYERDREGLRSFYDVELSPRRLVRLADFIDGWGERLDAVEFGALDAIGRVDHVLFRNHLGRERERLHELRERAERLAAFLPFAEDVAALEEARWRVEPVDAEAAAATLVELAEEAKALRGGEEEGDDDAEDAGESGGDDEAAAADAPERPSPSDALWLARRVDGLRRTLDGWHAHYSQYLPGFGWWCDAPHAQAREELEACAKWLREDVAEQKGEDDDPLVGDPIGRDALERSMRRELLAYSPDELLAIGERELAWCEARMREQAAAMGHGDDWRAALEEVKGLHVPPGEQDALVAAQAREAIAFLDERELVTIPPLCRETWRVRMLSEDEQKTLPFAAYGGQVMLVAYPTAEMDLESKRMALRGNNVCFTRAVTPHELIPGHHLQGFMAQRYCTQRRLFRTPFLVEGWALYWEMREWDLGWARTPEERIGMLFWRMHRAARILVSLSFHLGEMTPQEMIDFLVERVGHERDGATSEVRRYVGEDYGPLYQCAYMIGGLQLRALHAELVASGAMDERAFHDAVLRQNAIPVEALRAALRGAAIEADFAPTWRFAGDLPPRAGR